MTAQSASIPWRKLESWQNTTATYLLHHYHLSPEQADRATRQLVLALVWLYGWEQKGFINTPLQSCQGKQAYAKFLQSLATLHTQLGLPDLFPWLTQFELEESLLQAILTDLCSVEGVHPMCSNQKATASTLLGQVYEQLLGQSIASSAAKRSSANSIKKFAGIFYTPPAIVQFMLQSTLSRLLPEPRSPSDPFPRLRLLDPACGSGAFLVAAYEYLLDWYLQQYLIQDHAALPNQTALQLSQDGHWQLTQAERERILLTHIFGVDIDPQAVIVTQLCLWIALAENLPNPIERSLPSLDRNIQVGNALTSRTHSQIEKKSKLNNPELLWSGHLARFDWEKAFPEIFSDGGFDLVLGNPPYIDSEGMTLHQAEWRTYCRQHYRTAQGNWDLFCIFIEKAIELCRPGGLTSLIVPNKLAAAPYARIARQILSQENQLLLLRDYSQVPVFAASVYSLVYVAEKTPPETGQSVGCETMQDLHQIQSVRSLPLHAAPPEAPWLLTATPTQFNLLLRLRQTFPALSTIAQVTGAATVEEAYRIQPLICEHPEPTPGDLRLVNSGTIDRYSLLWGKKQLRYLGQTYQHPVILAQDTALLPPKRYQQATQPKLIIAGITQQLEGALDAEGTVLAGKSTSVIQTAAIDLRYLLGVLNSQLIRVYFNHWFAGNRLQGGYFRVGPPQLRQLPICIPDLAHPAERQAYEQIITWVEQRLKQEPRKQPTNTTLEAGIDRLVFQLYHLTDTEISSIFGK